MKKLQLLLVVVFISLGTITTQSAKAQIKLEDIINLDVNDILGQLGNKQLIKIDKGFSPVFYIGDFQINKIGILGEKLKGIGILGDILDKKRMNQIMGFYKTYKTGLVVFKVLSAAGTAVTIVSTVKGLSNANSFNDPTVKKMFYPALGSLATGIITKLITKKASYKAVDIFNGVAKKTLKDILSVKPASSTIGVGLYVKL